MAAGVEPCLASRKPARIEPPRDEPERGGQLERRGLGDHVEIVPVTGGPRTAPDVPNGGARWYSSAAAAGASRCRAGSAVGRRHLVDGVAEQSDPDRHLLLGDRERRRHPHRVVPRPQDQKAALETGVLDGPAGLG